MDKEIKVLLVDDSALVRDGIARYLQSKESIVISGLAKDANEVLSMLSTGLDVDIVLADLNMPEIDGIELAEILKGQFSEISTIILTMHANETFIDEALKAGVKRYLIKGAELEEIYDAILSVSS